MKKILAFAIAAGMLASCSNEDEAQPQAEGVALGVSSASLESVITKATTDLVTDGATIGVYRLPLNGYAQSYAEFYYNASSPAWTIRNTADNIYLNNLDATVCGITPYISAQTDPASIDLIPQVYSVDGDISFSSQLTANNTGNIVSFDGMNHAFSQITFVIEKDATYTGAGLITQISMSGAEIFQGTVLDITSATPAYTNGSNSSSTPLVFSGLSLTALAHEATPAASQGFLVVPVAALTASNMNFSFLVDGKTMSCTVTPTLAPFEGFTALERGHNYKFTVTIKGTALQVTSVSIIDWTDDEITTPLEPTPAVS